eukprot:TRINITY_DN17457_c0_g1_i1.p1 TRINITY_DN17457_c0_g1~~TRINITY_DN17457_c0_g1_i1.p1  ORF type:complete len:164 (-),score=43.70 TRINITY_DN17457_c0_g1_i1:22-447(-)
MGIWLYADSTMDPTQEESAMYEFHIGQQVRPPPVYSPNLPRPSVNWTTLNKHKRKNLPDPERVPIKSCPDDPTFYMNVTKYKPVDKHITTLPSGLMATNQQCGCAQCIPPFGFQHGLRTDMGIISMPDTAVHGYKVGRGSC